MSGHAGPSGFASCASRPLPYLLNATTLESRTSRLYPRPAPDFYRPIHPASACLPYAERIL